MKMTKRWKMILSGASILFLVFVVGCQERPKGEIQPAKEKLDTKPRNPNATTDAAKYDLDQMVLVKVENDASGQPVASVRLPDGKVLQIKVGDKLGVKEGMVTQMDQESLVVEERGVENGEPVVFQRLLEKKPAP